MVLMRGFHIGTIYKLLGNVNSTGYNNTTIPEVELTANDSTETDSTTNDLIFPH
jgi:hypothetical protein